MFAINLITHPETFLAESLIYLEVKITKFYLKLKRKILWMKLIKN